MPTASRKARYFTLHNIDRLPQLRYLNPEQRFDLSVVGQVLPFRVNDYVTDELIDWSNIPDDPIFQLTFMQKGMLTRKQFESVADLLKRNAPRAEINSRVSEIRMQLSPHPNGQKTANVPSMYAEPVPGIQHKYRETCLVFPARAQTCHATCTFCFRWPQFVGTAEDRFATDTSRRYLDYLRRHEEVTDVLFTGGDPMIMTARHLSSYIEPLLEAEFDHIQTIRIGTKSISFWPHRFVTDQDADDVLRLFERVVAAGKHLAIMGHFNHWKELSTPVAHEAIRRVRSTGAEIRTQSPLIRHINDDARVWARMWKEQVRLGCVPYYMFVERDTGAKQYFALPLFRAWEIYQKAIQQVSGLGRTVRGPSMSAFPGKVSIDGITEIYGEKVFVLNFLQAREPNNVMRPFFARFDPAATWLSDLKPAFGKQKFFFEEKADERLNVPVNGNGLREAVSFEIAH